MTFWLYYFLKKKKTELEILGDEWQVLMREAEAMNVKKRHSGFNKQLEADRVMSKIDILKKTQEDDRYALKIRILREKQEKNERRSI
jgi:hypothetical protein